MWNLVSSQSCLNSLNESGIPNDFFSTQNTVIYGSKHIYTKTSIELDVIDHLTGSNQYSGDQ